MLLVGKKTHIKADLRRVSIVQLRYVSIIELGATKYAIFAARRLDNATHPVG